MAWSNHLRGWGRASVLGGTGMALILAAVIGVRVPAELTASGIGWTLLAMWGTSVAIAAALAPPAALGCLVWGRLVGTWDGARAWRAASLGVPLAWALACAVAFGLREGQADVPTALGLAMAAVAGLGLGVAGSWRLAMPEGGPHAAWWMGVLAAGIAIQLPPPPLPPHHPPEDPAHHRPSDPPVERPGEAPGTVVLVVVDTLRADHLGAYGYPRQTSPRIDALARDGVRFAQLHAASACTVPSTASVLTGLAPYCHGIQAQGFGLPEEAVTVAERFQAAGYRTFGIAANPLIADTWGFEQGFESLVNESVAPHYTQAAELTERTLSFLDGVGDAPAFVYLHFMDPHWPYNPPPELLSGFRGDALDLDHELPVCEYGSYGGTRPARMFEGTTWEEPLTEGYATARYDAEILKMDHAIAALMDGLAARGRADDLVFMLTGDHGETLTEHHEYYQHCHDTYRSTTHVPGIVYAPGRVPAGAVVEAPTAHIDLVPSLLGVSRIPAAHREGVQGRDLTDAAAGGAIEPTPIHIMSGWDDGVVANLLGGDAIRPIRSVVWDGHKLVLPPHHRLAQVRGPLGLVLAWRAVLNGTWRPEALYDLAADPGERVNVIGDHPDIAASLRAHLALPGPGVRCPITPGNASEGDDALRERLEALGYME